MKKCPRCDEENSVTRKYCIKCKEPLGHIKNEENQKKITKKRRSENHNQAIKQTTKSVPTWLKILIFWIIMSILINYHKTEYETKYKIVHTKYDEKRYEIVNDTNVLVESQTCSNPYKKIGMRCCIPSEDMPFTFCKDERQDFMTKLNQAINEKMITDGKMIYTRSNVINNEYGFSFRIPEGYLIVENTTEGGFNSPYTFFTFGTDTKGNIDSKKEIDISIVNLAELYTNGIGSYVRNNSSGFENKTDEEINKISELMGGVGITNNTWRVIKTSQGYEVIVTENVLRGTNTSNFNTYGKMVWYLDQPILLVYVSPKEYSMYVKDFDEMLNSLHFITFGTATATTRIKT